MKQSGFTVIELVITITIMGILMTLGVAGFVNSLANSRDAERKADVEAIAVHLENFYKYGADNSIGDNSSEVNKALGQYPSTAMSGFEKVVMRDIDPKSLRSPGVDVNSAVSLNYADYTGVPDTTQITTSDYVYQPIKLDGDLCNTSTDECRKFNLYYMTETDTSANNPNCNTDKICMIESKNQ